MNYLRIAFTLALFTLANIVYGQKNNEEEGIKKAINALFDGMRKSDSTLMRTAFNPQAILQTIVKTKAGATEVRSTDLNLFIKSIAKPHAEIYDERIVFTKILIDDALASVWTDYQFYIGDKFSHCGVNSFQLVKVNNDWKIVYLIDTRRKENCN
ncbi:nuclear transport factor 2 family protein [Pedobacter chitinilyticus]|uniref:Nuclear transport factor 2 family protein n=1 Tax=Pedobacter chitinilyticus TaxID=2233776 RepID=A0A443YR88_9SPHI|nr:nuclear transport factor 2 family protein [Pedobacter chitinilyticus]RWU06304.1 hypothetical protein DPV69_13510 [Pedobacter chitinilyticus]